MPHLQRAGRRVFARDVCLPPQDPSLGQGSRLEVAEVKAEGGTAKLINKRTVHQSPDTKCRLESQDFCDNDTKMTFTCYAPGSYNEREGIFPDGFYTLVAADRECEEL